MILARVVLPQPGGPQSIREWKSPVAQNSVEYLSRPEQVRLPDELTKVAGTHPFGQRRLFHRFVTGTVFEYI